MEVCRQVSVPSCECNMPGPASSPLQCPGPSPLLSSARARLLSSPVWKNEKYEKETFVSHCGALTVCSKEGTECGLELETKVKRRFAKVCIVSYSYPSLMIIASASQFHVYLPWGQHLFSIVS